MKDFFAALALIKDIVTDAKAIMAFLEANKNEAWYKSSRSVAEQLRAAKTPEERRQIAKDILSLWAGL